MTSQKEMNSSEGIIHEVDEGDDGNQDYLMLNVGLLLTFNFKQAT